MTLLILDKPILILLALGCTALAAFAAKKGTPLLYWVCIGSLTGLVIAALACMIPYREIVLLLVPAVYTLFRCSGKEECP